MDDKIKTVNKINSGSKGVVDNPNQGYMMDSNNKTDNASKMPYTMMKKKKSYDDYEEEYITVIIPEDGAWLIQPVNNAFEHPECLPPYLIYSIKRGNGFPQGFQKPHCCGMKKY